MEKAIAVVVTYNRQALLSECITALRNQSRPLDAILIINNGSTDSTEQWLQTQSDLIVISQKNVGSAGGFSTGINWAYKNNYSWIWCMDDDGYPKEDALERLLDADDGTLKLRNCAVIDKKDKKSFVWKTANYKTIDDVDCRIIEEFGHPFNGTMLHRKIVERVGVPSPSFFLWGDETEYYYRITRKNNIPVCTIADSIHYHPATAFSVKKDWDYNSGWKMYYYVRNRLRVHKAKFSSKPYALINYACFLTAFAAIILLYQKTDKLKKLSFIMWPAADAFNNNFNASPDTIVSRLKETKTHSLSRASNNYMRSIWASLIAPFTLPRASRDTANA